MSFLKIVTAILLLALFSAFFAHYSSDLGKDLQTTSLVDRVENPGKLSKRDRMDLAMEQEFERIKDEALGYVPRERLYKAFLEAERRRTEYAKSNKFMLSPTWTERGPNNVGGRTRAIMIDPNDGTNKTVFAAGVSGGLWRTTDITATNPAWSSINDFFENMAITTIAYDPTNTNTMYFGTGEGWFNIDAVRGDGIFKSTNGGSTWTQLASTTGSTFNYVQKIVVHPDSGDVYAATRDGGVMRSTDGGTSWSSVLASGNGASTFRAADIEIAADSSLYAAMGIFTTDGIYSSSTGNTGSWTKLNTGSNGMGTSGFNRIELALAPANENVIYALTHDPSDGSVEGIYRSANKGSTWSSITPPTDDDPGVGSDFTRSQAWYNLIAAVSPTDATGDTMFIGGIDLFKTTDGGSNWTQISHWYGGFGYQEVHADQHAIVFVDDNPDEILFGNDGGIYRSTTGTDPIPTITSKESNYNTTQFYSVALHPDAGSNHFLGGTQDNGTNKFSTFGINSTIEVVGGDGGFCHIDQDSSDIQFAATTRNNIYRSTDGGLSFTRVLANSTGNFINASDYDNNNYAYYSAFSGGSYVRWANPRTGTDFFSQSITAFNGSQASAITASPNTAYRVFFGTEAGRIVRVENANTASASGTHINSGAGMPSSDISCIAVEDGDDNHILVTYFAYGANSIWETTDGGSNWTSVEGDLPDMPVRWALFNPDNSDQCLIATELGVWSTDDLDGGSTSWAASNNGLANVRVDMLQYRESDGLVIAATHGRGMYTTDIFAASVNADFGVNKTIGYIGGTFTFVDGSLGATSWSWNFGDGNTSTLQNPTHTYSTAGKYNITLTINSGEDSEVKSSYIHVLPNRGTPYITSDGGDFESNPDDFGSAALTGDIDLWERGTPGNDIMTLNSGTNGWKTDLDADIVEENYSCALYSPSFNLTVPGTYSISFRKSMAVRYSNAPFGVYVEYSIDQGESWTRLGTDSDGNGTNWYERGPAGTSHLVTPDGYAFCSDFTNENTAYDISSLSGNNDVCFRIVYVCASGFSDNGYTEDGFMVDDFQITGESNDPVLPVELQSFSVNPLPDETAVELAWDTQSELNNSHWLIERSTEGSDWLTLAQLDGQGTTPAPTEYSYIDQQVQNGIRYTYRIADVSYAGVITYHTPVTILMVANTSNEPKEFALNQNYPNPFNPSTTISYNLKRDVRTSLTIYNLLGEKVVTLIDERQEAGAKNITWFGNDEAGNKVASGVYVYRLKAGSFVKSRKMILLY